MDSIRRETPEEMKLIPNSVPTIHPLLTGQ